MKPRAYILLLILIGLQLPWSSIDFCVAHPFGEPDHGPGLSNCEKRAMWQGETAVWPPMHCLQFAMSTDAYEAPAEFTFEGFETQATTPAFTLIAEIRVRVLIIADPPVPRCRSHPTRAVPETRGPPQLFHRMA